jgi:hypothetical protein
MPLSRLSKRHAIPKDSRRTTRPTMWAERSFGLLSLTPRSHRIRDADRGRTAEAAGEGVSAPRAKPAMRARYVCRNGVWLKLAFLNVFISHATKETVEKPTHVTRELFWGRYRWSDEGASLKGL